MLAAVFVFAVTRPLSSNIKRIQHYAAKCAPNIEVGIKKLWYGNALLFKN